MAITPSEVAITAGSGTQVSTTDITNGANTDKRQVVCIGGPDKATDLAVMAVVDSAPPATGALGLVTRLVSEQAQGASPTGVPAVAIQGLVNTNAPTLTDGTLSIPSLTLCGAQRVDGSSNEVVKNAQTLTVTGSAVVDGLQYREVNIIVNVKGTVSGTTPVLVVSVFDVDPVDLTTQVGQAVTGANITATAAVQTLTHNSKSGTVMVKWTITGTTPSFGGTNISLNSKDVAFSVPNSGTKSNVAGNGASTTILAANSQRKAATFFNDSTSSMYLDLTGGTASNASFSVKIMQQQTYELPQPAYTGAITGIWDTATGNARITEFV
jgi:hypothetical protein